MKLSSLEDFENAFVLLDEKLKKENLQLRVRAIGGFVMMYYGLRGNGYTIDVDSLTDDYDVRIQTLIKEVGKELSLDEEWLNTDCATLEGFLDGLASEIEWQDTRYAFSNIDIKIADIKGMIRSKAKAIHDGGLVPRSTDKKDLLRLLEEVHIGDLEELDQNVEYAFIRDEYARCYDFLAKENSWK